MSAHIALFRALNVGGANRIAMKDLTLVFDRLGFGPATSLQAAGSFVFRSGADPAAIEAALEGQVRADFGLTTTAIVRSLADWQAGLAENPFVEAVKASPDKVMILTLKSTPLDTAPASLANAAKDGELTAVGKGFAYVVYPNGAGRSRLSPQIIDRRLGTASTARNWNSAQKLAALAEAL